MMVLTSILSFSALYWAAVTAVPSEITVMEGDDATFASGLNDTVDVVLIDKATDAVLLYSAMGEDKTEKKSIDVHIEDGALIMPHVQRSYSEDYELRIYTHPLTTSLIRLNVIPRRRLDSDASSLTTTPPLINEEPTLRSPLGLYISLGLIGLVGLVVALVCYLKKQRSSSGTNSVQAALNPQGELSCCIDVTGADSSASTSRSDSLVPEKEKEEEKLVTTNQT